LRERERRDERYIKGEGNPKFLEISGRKGGRWWRLTWSSNDLQPG